jgi:hypothetical protein
MPPAEENRSRMLYNRKQNGLHNFGGGAMAEQEKICYLVINGKKYGPLSEQDIQKLYAAKKINGDVKFAKIGAKEWIPLSQSGIIDNALPVKADDLPPLPPGDVRKPNSKKKMSAGGKIIAALVSIILVAVGIVGAIAGLRVLLLNSGNNELTVSQNTVTRDSVVPTPTEEPEEPKLAANEVIGPWEWEEMSMTLFFGEEGVLFGLSNSILTKGRYTVFQNSVICYWDESPDEPMAIMYSVPEKCFYIELKDGTTQYFMRKPVNYNNISGTWEIISNTVEGLYNFTHDGSVSLNSENETVEGTYRVVANNVIINFGEFGSYTMNYYPEIDLLHSITEDGSYNGFRHVGAQTGELTYKGIPLAYLTDTVDEVINRLGPANDTATSEGVGGKVFYDDLEFYVDEHNSIGSVYCYNTSALKIDGIPLNKNRAELIELLGDPAEEYGEYDDEAGTFSLRYYIGDYNVRLELGIPDNKAWRIVFGRSEANMTAETAQDIADEAGKPEADDRNNNTPERTGLAAEIIGRWVHTWESGDSHFYEFKENGQYSSRFSDSDTPFPENGTYEVSGDTVALNVMESYYYKNDGTEVREDPHVDVYEGVSLIDNVLVLDNTLPFKMEYYREGSEPRSGLAAEIVGYWERYLDGELLETYEFNADGSYSSWHALTGGTVKGKYEVSGRVLTMLHANGSDTVHEDARIENDALYFADFYLPFYRAR